MIRILAVLIALVSIVAIPFALKPSESLLANADETIVIVTPHNEQIRYEFSRAFAAYYQTRTGRTIRIDWRMPGKPAKSRAFSRENFTLLSKGPGNPRASNGLPKLRHFDDPKAPNRGAKTIPRLKRRDRHRPSSGRRFRLPAASRRGPTGRLWNSAQLSRLVCRNINSPLRFRRSLLRPRGRWLGTVLRRSGSATIPNLSAGSESTRFRQRGPISGILAFQTGRSRRSHQERIGSESV